MGGFEVGRCRVAYAPQRCKERVMIELVTAIINLVTAVLELIGKFL